MSTDTTAIDRINDLGAVFQRTKYLLISYPALMLGVFVVIPIGILFVVSFFQNIEGGFYEPALTLENYARFFGSDLYRGRVLYTLRLAAIVSAITLVVGYPIAYYISQLSSRLWRRIYISTIISTLFLTFIIRAFAWQVLLESDSVVPMIGAAIGIMDEASSLVPSYFALVVSMVYVFLPFMVITLYVTLKNIDRSLIEASRDLGAGPITTFIRVTLPLSKNGIISGVLLVFTLSLGIFVLPRILANPPQWTIAVLVGEQVGVEGNVPFGAAISVVILTTVLIMFAIGGYLMDDDSEVTNA